MNQESERIKIRRMFFETWNKYKAKSLLEPLEQQIINIILQHPEYHFILDNPDKYLDQDYSPDYGETNPFLHLGLHMSIVEQVQTNRPTGITYIYHHLTKKLGNSLEAEHAMMDCLVKNLWQAQQTGQMISEEEYLAQIKQLLYL